MPLNNKTYPWEAPNNRGHVWQTEDGGDVDIFAFNPSKYCNGPLCVHCGYGFCHHCQKLPEEDCAQGKKND